MTNLTRPAGIELRFAGRPELRKEGGVVHVAGHAAIFNQETDIGGYFRERILPGAFMDAIARDDVPFLIEHEGLPLARNTSGTLKLSEDDIGLMMESDLAENDPDVMRIVPKMERGDLSKMSFAFLAEKEEWDETGDVPVRTLMQVRLFDVSIVTSPAYEGTSIGMRSLESWRAAQELERKRQNFQAASVRVRLSRGLDLRARNV